MKKIILKILLSFNKLFFPRFSCPKELIVVTFKNIFIQKIIGINRKVKWPVHYSSKIVAPENIKPGSRAPGFNMSCYLDGRNGITLGKNVWIGPRVSIISQNHSLDNYKKYLKGDSIKIGDNCWIAANVVILPGVEIGNHVVIAAGSVVTKSFIEDNIIIGGVPAKKIKSISKYNG